MFSGDLNGDGKTGLRDFKILLKGWSVAFFASSSADLNFDGVVNGLDFGELIRFAKGSD